MKYQNLLSCLTLLLVMFAETACVSQENVALINTSTPSSSFMSTKMLVTAIPSSTELPPINPANAKQILASFVQRNGGCKLPCLMGISPITSNAQSVEAFGQYFREHSQQSNSQLENLEIRGNIDNDSGGAWLVFWKDHVRVDVILGIALKNNAIEHITLSTGVYKHLREGGQERAELLVSHPDYDELLANFSLSQILLDYGRPSEIWVLPFPEDHPNYTYASSSYPFDFILLYLDQGFAVEYMSRVKENDTFLVGCPKTAYVKISSWDPERQLEFSDIAQFFSGTDSLSASNFMNFKELQTVTSLTVNDFYDQYKVQNSNECVETSRHLWP